MNNFKLKQNYDINDMLEIVKLLRDPVDGCPWDKVQTHASIRKNFIEETYEVADAIDAENPEMLCEELGDIMLQVLLHCTMESEKGNFDFNDVCDGICKKLIYRHPHIFGNVKVNSTDDVLANWDKLKEKEKSLYTAQDNLKAVPNALPALMRSQKVQKRAAKYGFEYSDVYSALSDLQSEIEELKHAAAENKNIKGETGDVLFSAVNVGRMLGVDCEEALGETCTEFIRRVSVCEENAAKQGKELTALDSAELDRLWKTAKQTGLAEK